MFEAILRDMACSAPHKSAVGVNTSQERCDNVSITLGSREGCLWSGRRSVCTAQRSVCTLAALPLFLGTEGPKDPGYMCDSDVYQGIKVWRGLKWYVC